MNRKTTRWLLAASLLLGAAACGSDETAESTPATAGAATPEVTEAAATPDVTDPPAAPVEASGDPIVLAANPWTGSAVNVWVAKTVLEAQGIKADVLPLDENATWLGMADGDIDASLEVWPSGHAADYETYITGQKSIVDIGPLGPKAKIGWYIPTKMVEEHPELATWEGFKDPELAKLFATAETGDQGQFLMGDPSYVSYDEQIIKNLGLPLKFIVAGSEATLISAIQDADTNGTPLLLQFWQPHWLQSQVSLTEIALPEVTDACLASAAAGDGAYECDYAPDTLYKIASAGLETKNPAAFAILSKFQLTTEQQNEIAAMIDSDGMDPADAAAKWVADNADVVAGWTS